MAFLTKAQAEQQAERLAHHIRKHGATVVIDLRTGAGGNHWGVDTFWGAMDHHIVSRRSQGLTPFYSLVRNGRSDVPGPLCNIYGGWDRVARIVTMGLANHPGKGGPWVISGHRIPQDNGRYYFLGTEFEGGLNEADWDADYRRFMGAVNAGKLDYIRELRSGVTIRDTALCEHSNWARPKGRKIDRLGYTQARGIAEMQAARRTSEVGGITIPPTTTTPRTTAQEDEDMYWLAVDKATGKNYVGNGIVRRHLADKVEKEDLRVKLEREGRPWTDAGVVDRIGWLGVEVK